MTVPEILDELASLGSEQTLKIYHRHGLEGPAFGVKYGDLEKLACRLKKRPDLAPALWASGNHDARVLATKIADPELLTKETLVQWAGDINRVLVADFSSLVSRSPHATDLAEAWTKTGPELSQVTGWFVVASLATRDETIARAWFEPFLNRIAGEMTSAPNRTKYALNEALIAIGGRNEVKLRDAALKIAKRIGPVEVDHGETGCKTPDAIAYIGKIWARRKSKTV